MIDSDTQNIPEISLFIYFSSSLILSTKCSLNLREDASILDIQLHALVGLGV